MAPGIDRPIIRGQSTTPALRSQDHQRGLPACAIPDCQGCDGALHGRYVGRVEKANALLDFTAQLLDWLQKERPAVTWSIEGPSKALFWQWYSTPRDSQARTIAWDACMMGGDRKSATSCLTNLPGAESLQRQCEGTGSHAACAKDASGTPLLHVPWSASRIRKGGAASSCYEQAYPPELCLRLLRLCATAHRMPADGLARPQKMPP